MRLKNGLIAIILLATFLCCSGCGTIRGAVTGFGEDIQAAGKGIGKAGEAINKGDEWFRENLW